MYNVDGYKNKNRDSNREHRAEFVLLAEYLNPPQCGCQAEVLENVLAQYRDLVSSVLDENRQDLMLIQ
jgi:hypothetical protein